MQDAILNVVWDKCPQRNPRPVRKEGGPMVPRGPWGVAGEGGLGDTRGLAPVPAPATPLRDWPGEGAASRMSREASACARGDLPESQH